MGRVLTRSESRGQRDGYQQKIGDNAHMVESERA